jgi:hypothetical protein
MEPICGLGDGVVMGGKAAYTTFNSGVALAWASTPSCSPSASLSRGSSPAWHKYLLSGAFAEMSWGGAHTLHRQKDCVD